MARIMDIAYIRDKDLIHTDEAVVLAMLLKTHSKTQRSRAEVENVDAIVNRNK
jgi:hypothetical protein